MSDPKASAARPPKGGVSKSVVRTVFGRPLANREGESRKIAAWEGVPAMGLDGLGSSAYGPEAALAVMIPLGAGALVNVGPILLVILGLLAVLYLSYRQTIVAYPTNGGAYVVARENLGVNASLLAAAALMIDYVLNVAVGVSAGVAALVSVLPHLQPYILPICLGVLVFITAVNLRGTQESGRLFAIPTYLFLISFLGLIAVGVVRTLLAHGHPAPVDAPPALKAATAAGSLWFILRAFAAGCTAMTGVEAVSNGVGAFKEPRIQYAHRTLTGIVVSLALLLGGVAFLAGHYRIGAMDQTRAGYQSVLSQLAAAVLGRGWAYDVAMASVLSVLMLSANTSFVGFPRMCRLVAENDFLPRSFAQPGRRLVYSAGILFLAVCAGALIIAFGGITDRLIPLFAIGAFLTFTLSQAGMVAHWRCEPGRRARLRLAVNAVGATTTGAALAVILIAKFTEGAWITVLAIPAVIVLLKLIKGYYQAVNEALALHGPMRVESSLPPIVVVATENFDRLNEQALSFAASLSPDVIALHLTELSGDDENQGGRLRRQWKRDVQAPAEAEGRPAPRLVMLKSDYRTLADPVLKFLAGLETEHPGRRIAVLMPELVKLAWWQHALHSHRGRRLRAALLRHGGSRVVVINLPWKIEPSREGDKAILPETPTAEEAARPNVPAAPAEV